MIKPIATEEERIRLVKECYQSGLTANEWCRRNGISRNTFHTWVNRLRKRGLIETAATIPTVINCEEIHPEIVKINIGNDGQTITESEIQDLQRPTWQEKSNSTLSIDTVMMVAVGNVRISVTNNINPKLLAETLRLLGGAEHC